MKRKDIIERLNNLFEEKKKDLKKKEKGSKEKPYVEDPDIEEQEESNDEKKTKKLRKDKGAYKEMASTGVKDSTVAEERIEESIDPKIKKEIDAMRKKRKDEIEILMALDKKHGKKLSKRDMEEIAEYISND